MGILIPRVVANSKYNRSDFLLKEKDSDNPLSLIQCTYECFLDNHQDQSAEDIETNKNLDEESSSHAMNNVHASVLSIQKRSSS